MLVLQDQEVILEIEDHEVYMLIVMIANRQGQILFLFVSGLEMVAMPLSITDDYFADMELIKVKIRSVLYIACIWTNTCIILKQAGYCFLALTHF